MEITEGRFLGMDMAGEKVKVFIDHKNSIVYDYGLKTCARQSARPMNLLFLNK